MSNKAKIKEEALKLNPIDDIMFRKMAENIEFCEEILRVILEDSNLVVLEAVPQWTGTNLQGRCVILDAKCITEDNEHINIEIQRADDDDHQRRVRYNASILTTNITEPGTKFKDIPNVTIVYISKFDIFNEKLPMYHIDRIIRETKTIVNNGFREIYVNCNVNDGSDVANLMQIFTDNDTYSDNFPVTSQSKRIFKKTEGGVHTMCEIMEKIAAEERREGIIEGKRNGVIETLFSLVQDGILNIEEAAKRADMTKDAFSESMKQFMK